MSEILKRTFNIGIGKETVRGTKVTPAIWLKPTSEDYNDRAEVINTERSMGIIEDSEDMVVAKKYSSGVLAGEIFDKSFGYLLLSALGQVSSVESADSGVYDHTFTVLQSAQHPSITVEIKRGDIEQKAYPNVVVETLKINSAVNQYVMFEVDLKGKVGEASTSTPSYVVENYFLAKDISVKLADTYAGLGAASAIDVKSFNLEIAKNIEDDDVLGTDGPSDFLNKQFVVEGSMELNFSTVYERDYVLNNTVKSMRITLLNSSTTIGLTSNPEIVIDLAKVKFSEAPITGGNNDLAKVEVKFKAFYSVDESFSVKAVLTNTQATY